MPKTLTKLLPHLSKTRNYATDATFEITHPFRLHHLDTGPSLKVALSKPDALLCYEQMATIRRMETTIGNLYKKRMIRGFCHLYSGQEAVAVGFCINLRPNDYITTSYRNHGWTLLKYDLDPKPVLAELLGLSSGCARGKGGSMHMYAPNFNGGNGIVGAQVPLGVGVALAQKYKNTDGVSLTVYGDGAANNGQVFEAFNMAKMWNLPCLFLCENNLYGMGTKVDRHAANVDFFKRGDLIPGLWVDGMDVLAVREAVKFAHAHILSGKGPIIIEAHTYRYYGHSMSDPGTSYRTHEEVAEIRKQKDPIASFKKRIVEAGLVDEKELGEIDTKVKKKLEKAVEEVVKDKEVGIEELTYDIYAKDIEKEVRGVTPFKSLVSKSLAKQQNLN